MKKWDVLPNDIVEVVHAIPKFHKGQLAIYLGDDSSTGLPMICALGAEQQVVLLPSRHDFMRRSSHQNEFPTEGTVAVQLLVTFATYMYGTVGYFQSKAQVSNVPVAYVYLQGRHVFVPYAYFEILDARVLDTMQPKPSTYSWWQDTVKKLGMAALHNNMMLIRGIRDWALEQANNHDSEDPETAVAARAIHQKLSMYLFVLEGNKPSGFETKITDTKRLQCISLAKQTIEVLKNII